MQWAKVMTERDLESLKGLTVPVPREQAKRAARDAALTAFDEANTTSALAAGAPLGVSEAPKGNIVPLRLTETSRPKRSFLMRVSTRQTQAIAASLAALVIAAPIAFQQYGRSGLPIESSAVKTELAPKRDAQPATAPSIAEARPEPNVGGEQGPKLAFGPKDKTVMYKMAPLSGLGAGALSGNALGLENGSASLERDRRLAPVLVQPPAPPASEPSAAMIAPELNGYDALQRSRITAAPTDALKNLPMLQSSVGIARSHILKQNETVWTGDADAQLAFDREENRDKFDAKDINPVKQAAAEPVSTFSIDVDTASYSFVRRALNSGHLPPKDAVRVEEMINYFPYAYPGPESAETPFKPTVTVMPSPWNPNTKLVHVAIKGYGLKSTERPRANLVLLMDVSGSMQPEDRLPLVKNAFRLLVDQLKPDDTVGIVTYASGSGIALEPTKVSDKGKILAAIDKLGAGGSTAGAAGIADAYRLAEAGFDKGAVNRVILATDGDFNVGITDQGELKGFVERKRQTGIFLSILGVGQGNHNDALMQTLAQNGNGTAAYADTLNEARKVLVDESSSTLFTIAKDVKIQIEWNPVRVAEYRLIGYETRALRREDFNNDKVDAGDIGSGHTVTAIYEVTPAGSPQLADDLRYGKAAAAKLPVRTDDADPAKPDVAKSGELGFLKLRYKKPNEDVSQLLTVPLTDALAKTSVTEVPAEARFSIAVAAFGQLVKGAPYTQGYTFDDVLALAQAARGDDPFGYRAEFLNLVRLAKSARP